MIEMTEVQVARFWAQVDISAGEAGCWPWRGRIEPARGYGVVNPSGHGGKVGGYKGTKYKRAEYAHRVAWMLTHGAVPPRRKVGHRCRRNGCCNPRHVYLVSVWQRPQKSRGERKSTRLTDADVRAIRQVYATQPSATLTGLARGYAVSISLIARIVHGERRAQVEPHGTPAEAAQG